MKKAVGSEVECRKPLIPQGEHFVFDEFQFIDIIDAERLAVVGEIRTGGKPQHLVMDRAGRTLWVTNPSREVVQVIDLIRRRVIREIYTGPQPQQMAPRSLGLLTPAKTAKNIPIKRTISRIIP